MRNLIRFVEGFGLVVGLTAIMCTLCVIYLLSV